MAYNVRIYVNGTESTATGVDGVFFVNPGTFGDPLDLYEAKTSTTVNKGDEVLFINTAAVDCVRIKKV